MAERQSIGNKIGARMGGAIVKGKYQPGELLPTEFELTRLFGVGRSTVREAIKLLAAKGLVSSRRRDGTRVTEHEFWNLLDPDVLQWLQETDYSHQLLFELAQTRLAIEPEACAIVAHRRSRVDFSPMDQALVEMDKEGAGEEGILQADLDFHLGILDATANRFFINMKPLVATTLRFGFELIDLYKLDQHGNTNDHRVLFDAMIDGDPERARKIARDMTHQIEIKLRPLVGR